MDAAVRDPTSLGATVFTADCEQRSSQQPGEAHAMKFTGAKRRDGKIHVLLAILGPSPIPRISHQPVHARNGWHQRMLLNLRCWMLIPGEGCPLIDSMGWCFGVMCAYGLVHKKRVPGSPSNKCHFHRKVQHFWELQHLWTPSMLVANQAELCLYVNYAHVYKSIH